MKNLKLILLNPETNEVVSWSPVMLHANIDSYPRHLEVSMDFHGMPHEEFNKLATMIGNAF